MRSVATLAGLARLKEGLSASMSLEGSLVAVVLSLQVEILLGGVE